MAAGLAIQRRRRHVLSGDLPEFRRDRLAFLSAAARERGDFAPLRFGVLKTVLVNDPVAIEQVLSNSTSFVKSLPYQMVRPVVGNGLLLSEGEFWKRQRRLAQPVFQRARMSDAAAPVIAELAATMLRGWSPTQERDVHADMMRLTAQIAGRVFFGADVADATAEVGRQLQILTEIVTARFDSTLAFLPNALPTPANLRMRRAVKKLDAVIFAIIQQRRQRSEAQQDLLSTLVAAQDQDGGRMTDRQLRDEVMTFFLAGHETTSLLLSWGLFLLARHPRVQARLRQELTGIGDTLPTTEEVGKLAYLDAVLCETLRLYPPVWTMGRKAVRPVEIGGLHFGKGSTVLFSQWVLHRDQRYFEQPESFLPERWLDGLQQRLPRYAYFPFGAGQRICIGANFAMLEAGIILAMLLTRFGVRPMPGREPEAWPAFTLRPRSGVTLTITAPG